MEIVSATVKNNSLRYRNDLTIYSTLKYKGKSFGITCEFFR